MIGVCPILFIGWKIIKKSKFYKPAEVDLFKNLEEIEEYQANYIPSPPKYVTPLLSISYSLAVYYSPDHLLTSSFRNWFERTLNFLFG